MSEQSLELLGLGVKLVDQDKLASDITKRTEKILQQKEKEIDEKRLEKATNELNKTSNKLSLLKRRLTHAKISQRRLINEEIAYYTEELLQKQNDVSEINQRLKEVATSTTEKSTGRLPEESERDYLVRIGKITAFGTKSQFKVDDHLANEQKTHQSLRQPGFDSGIDTEIKSHVNLRQPGFDDSVDVDVDVDSRPLKKEVGDGDIIVESDNDDGEFPDIEVDTGSDANNTITVENNDEVVDIKEEEMGIEDDMGVEEDDDNDFSDSKQDDDYDDAADLQNEDIEYESIEEVDEDIKVDAPDGDLDSDDDYYKSERNVDDGNELVYQMRLKNWVKKRAALRKEKGDKESEFFKPHPTIPDAILDDKFKLPGDIYPSLFDYQKTCVQWLWELFNQKAGGIIGDEMGLGKTIQIISFLAGLHYSKLLDKPILIVVPATVLNQWINEFHKWWPPMRCVILHGIGSGMNSKVSEEKLEKYLESSDPNSTKKLSTNNEINAQEIVDRVQEKGHVLVTTYVGLKVYSKYILPRQWGYCVLDEGHKIRNPDSIISLTCKQIKTYNRIILSGTPIQNNLLELWSLFDFVFPGRLGTLPVFQQQFSIPINMGGYANASNIQVQTGYKCAVILRDLISPYLLRRLKTDVAQDLPKKNEMVLFVKLTQNQLDLYEKFLQSEELNSILKGRRNVLMGVDVLRKLCNHPDLVSRDILMHKKNYDYGNPMKSGKMQVLQSLLQLWQQHKHKTLLFCQTRQMLDILEKFIANLPRFDSNGKESESYFTYLRMDGSTPIGRRQNLVDQFNGNPNLDVFLLTTKVGGLGVNLTGADRVIIYDPDWNPSTDIQARERAWRLGQKKDITIYRLMTAGSIEEKIYHRQIFKTFLTNKILKDPKQRRFFKVNDLHDLFTLGDPSEGGTETGDMFDSTEVKFGGEKERKSTKLNKVHNNDDDFYKVANIAGVSKLDKFQGDGDEESDDKQDESRLMEGIFAKSGVHSTVKHDEIVDSSNNHELSLVEKEANNVALAAAEALKRSRKLTRKQEIGTPTWTGKFGLAGKFGPKKKFGKSVKPNLSSSSILKDLKQKSEVKQVLFAKKENKEVDKQELLTKLIDYLKQQSEYFGTSNDILHNSGIDMKNEPEIILVRSMLREVATWDKERKGWKLKEDYV